MKILFLCGEDPRIEQIALALRMRWPDLLPLVVSQGGAWIRMIEDDDPDLVFLAGTAPTTASGPTSRACETARTSLS